MYHAPFVCKKMAMVVKRFGDRGRRSFHDQINNPDNPKLRIMSMGLPWARSTIRVIEARRAQAKPSYMKMKGKYAKR